MRALALSLLFATVAATSAAPPVYPGAKPDTAPAGLGERPLPKSAKVYSTSDDFVTVKTWYRAHLGNVPELAQPGKEKTMDSFLLGSGPSAMVVMIQRLNGKTFIAIAPPL